MSKLLNLSEDMKNELRDLFEKTLKDTVLNDGKFQFQKSFQTNRKTTVIYTESAWVKQFALVGCVEKEIAWHGAVDKVKDEAGNVAYIVSDIMVYPQSTSAAYVDMDVEGYTNWLINHAQEPSFQKMHMQAHSHVNMSTGPSNTDLTHQKDLLKSVPDNGFYIFMIWNKKNERTCWIYDYEDDCLYENSDISIDIMNSENVLLSQYVKDTTKEMLKERRYYSGNYPSYNSYGGYNGYPYSSQSSYSSKGTGKKEPVPAPKPDPIPESKTTDKPVKKKKQDDYYWKHTYKGLDYMEDYTDDIYC